MGQNWILVNIDKQEAITTTKMGVAIYERIGYDLYSQLLDRQWKPVMEIMDSFRSVISTRCFADAILNGCLQSLPKRKKTPRSLGYLELPVELIQMVFSNIEDPWTAFRLGCANTRLLVLGEKRIHQLMGPPHWRGDRIICAGGYCNKDDIPEGLDLGDEYERFCDDSDGEYYGPYGWARTFQKPGSIRWKSSENGLDAGLLSGWDWTSPTWIIAHRMAEPKPIHMEETPSILWNLSKQVYFRRESIPNDLPNAAREFNSDDVMGTILLLQICWSTDSSLSLSYARSDDIKIHRGKWAGDRFELTRNDVLESRLKEEGSKWEDVSEEVIKLFVDVFEAESY